MQNTNTNGFIQFPILDALASELRKIQDELESIKQKLSPKQALFDLKEACILKWLSYGSLATAKYKHLQPNRGVPDVIACGRSRWKREAVQKCLRNQMKNWIKSPMTRLHEWEWRAYPPPPSPNSNGSAWLGWMCFPPMSLILAQLCRLFTSSSMIWEIG